MRIVIDTNVVISGTFFNGAPRRVLEAVVDKTVEACASVEIIGEYQEIVVEMIERKQGRLNRDLLAPLIAGMTMIETSSEIDACRDPDDNKFLECAVDSHAVYIVSGDKDLLVLEEYDGIEILTAAEFCKNYLGDE